MKTLYQSQFYTSYQSCKGRCFHINLGHKAVKLSFCQLLAFRQKVLKIDLDTHFNGENVHGMEILMLCNREHIFIFDTLQVADLKDLMRGTFNILEINSLVAS